MTVNHEDLGHSQLADDAWDITTDLSWRFAKIVLPYYVFVILSFLIGVPICTRMEKDYGHDPGQATWDEFVGQWTALFLLPKIPSILIASFLIFRALDIWKPFPARRSQKLPGGWGIMVDDLIVGVYTCLLLHLYILIF